MAMWLILSFFINYISLGAQCSPRHACPLYGPLLMQVHEHAGAAPALAALTHDRGGKRMRFDALTHAELKNGKNLENGIKKPAYMVPVCG
ncbi:hypothetical protein, partial [Klebsiella pneumoniae]|uniref:hypothetical protein n=1 Tax=Klebsiella pneumoniae TaxID=573 RepID=UPI001A8E5A52